jgi:hypothetical protein
LQTQAQQYAQLDPFQRATAGIYAGANRLGGAIGGMLGAQDPEMMRITQRQSLLQQTQPTNAQGWSDLGSKLMQAGDIRGAQEAYAKSQAFKAADLEARKTESIIAKNTADQKAAATPADIAKAQRIAALRSGIPAYKAAGDDQTVKLLEDELNALLPADKVPSFGADREAIAGELYENKSFSQLTPAQKAVVNKRVEQETKRGTTVNVSVAGQRAFSEKMGELDAKRVSEALSARDNAFATVRSLNQLEKLDDQGLISGSFATGRVGATNLLNTLGLASPADQQRLASSQNYQKVSGDVILGTLGGKLGAGFSNEDRKFIEGLVPQLETSAAARRQLITFMRNKNIEIADEATRLETYARDKDGLKGFQPKIPLGQSVPTSSMSADDLAKAAGGKIVNGKFVPNK